VRYAARGRRAHLTTNADSDFRYFADAGKVTALHHALNVVASIPAGQKTTASIAETLTYTPSYFLGLFAKTAAPEEGAQAPVSAADYGVADRTSVRSVTYARLNRSLTGRASFDVTAGYRHTSFLRTVTGASDLSGYDVGTHFGYGLSRGIVLNLGYDYREMRYGYGLRPVQHDINTGVDYDRPISRSRRTRLAFGFGSSLIQAPPPDRPTDPAIRQLRAVGNVLLTHQIGRTWTARLALSRSTQFVEDIVTPVFTNGITMMANGFINRRTDVGLTAAYASGIAFGPTHSTFESYAANARVRFGLNRSLAFFTEYVYYFYDFRQSLLVFPVPARMDRNGVKVGLTFWKPLIRN
jgi:hypothetical protein